MKLFTGPRTADGTRFAWRFSLVCMTIANNRRFHKHAWIILAFIALAFRLPGLVWGKDFYGHGSFCFLHFDEWSASRQILEYTQTGKIGRADYFYGFPTQILWTLRLFWGPLTEIKILLISRLLSVIFGVADVLLTYGITRAIFKKRMVAFLAGIFIALSPLHVTQSHYATPTISSTFWIYAAFMGCLSFQETREIPFLFIACISAAAAIAVKFGFITLIPLFYLLWKERHRWPGIAGLSLFVFSFLIWNGNQTPFRQINSITKLLLSDNFMMREHHRWLNPFVYGFDLIPGLGLPIFVFAGIGLAALIKQGFYNPKRSSKNRVRLICLELPLFYYAAVLCGMTLPFARHILPLLPYLAMVAAYGFMWTVKKRLFRRWAMLLFVFVFAYQAFCVGWNEKRFVLDPFFLARAWVMDHTAENEKVWFAIPNFYAQAFPPKKLAGSYATADYLLVSERMTMSFRRSSLTPLTNHPALSEGYHLKLLKDPLFLRDVYEGRNGFKPAAFFGSSEIFPEFWLYKRLFGSYVWRTGDWIIYRREAS